MSKYLFFSTAYFFMLIIFSCNKKENTSPSTGVYEYYPDGKVSQKFVFFDTISNGDLIQYYSNGSKKAEVKLFNYKWEGVAKRYYEEGGIFAIESYKQSKKNGVCFYFYKNGNIKNVENYKNDIRHGKYYEYYEKDSGRVQFEVDYISVRGKEFENSYTRYAPDGKVLEQIHKLSIDSNSDTVSLTDSLRINFEIIYPEFDKSILVIGDFDENFKLKDSLSLTTIRSENHKLTLYVKPEKTGINTLRGYVTDFKITKTDSKDKYSTIERDIYFEYKYSVKP